MAQRSFFAFAAVIGYTGVLWGCSIDCPVEDDDFTISFAGRIAAGPPEEKPTQVTAVVPDRDIAMTFATSPTCVGLYEPTDVVRGGCTYDVGNFEGYMC